MADFASSMCRGNGYSEFDPIGDTESSALDSGNGERGPVTASSIR